MPELKARHPGRSLFSTLRHRPVPPHQVVVYSYSGSHPVLKEALERSPVCPYWLFLRFQWAPLAEALASGGLTVFEITLRTKCALDAMIAMKKAVPTL